MVSLRGVALTDLSICAVLGIVAAPQFKPAGCVHMDFAAGGAGRPLPAASDLALAKCAAGDRTACQDDAAERGLDGDIAAVVAAGKQAAMADLRIVARAAQRDRPRIRDYGNCSGIAPSRGVAAMPDLHVI